MCSSDLVGAGMDVGKGAAVALSANWTDVGVEGRTAVDEREKLGEYSVLGTTLGEDEDEVATEGQGSGVRDVEHAQQPVDQARPQRDQGIQGPDDESVDCGFHQQLTE